MAIVPDVLMDAWSNGTSTALSISVALSKKAGKPLPWAPVRDAIDGSIRTRILERTEDSGAWPTDYSNSKNVKLRRPLDVPPLPLPPPPPPLPLPKPGVLVARAELRQIRFRISPTKSATLLSPQRDWISSSISRSRFLARTQVQQKPWQS